MWRLGSSPSFSTSSAHAAKYSCSCSSRYLHVVTVKTWPGLFKAHRLVCHSTLGWRVIKKKKKVRAPPSTPPPAPPDTCTW